MRGSIILIRRSPMRLRCGELEQRCDRPGAGVCRLDRRPWLRPACNGGARRARARGRRLHAGAAIELDLWPPPRQWSTRRWHGRTRAIAARRRSLRLGTIRSVHLQRRRRARGVERAGAAFCPTARRAWPAQDSGQARRRRRARDPQCRRLRGAGIGLRLSVALAYLRALEAEGVALEAARRMIFFRLRADADQFLTIAKFRALRKLWARVEASCGLARSRLRLRGNGLANDGAARSHVNILRATIAAFAAALGGADAITVLPFTAARGLPDRFARRIARNTSSSSSKKSHLAKSPIRRPAPARSRI